MSERIPCKSESCGATILPYTAQKTGGYCMPCQQAAQRAEREAFIRENRKDINLYEGIADPVEILIVMQTPRKPDPLENLLPYVKSEEQLYASLTGGEAQRLADYAAGLIGQEESERTAEMLMKLICFSGWAMLPSILDMLFRRNVFYPGLLFLGAPAVIRDQLSERVEWDDENRNHLLLALAWIGDAEVVSQFAKWREQPPMWRDKLHVAPERYAHEAGWELSGQGKRRNLFEEGCFALVAETASSLPPISRLEPSEQKCEWCGAPLTVLLDLGHEQARIAFKQQRGNRTRIATCLGCTCYSVVYTDIGPNGEFSWSKHNQRPAYLDDAAEEAMDFGGREWYLAAEPRHTYYAASWVLEAGASQVGGYPTWVQDAEYPACPSCRETMAFLGQLDGGEMMEYGEGIYYAFLCSPCQVAATHYQQT
ncbi:DUF1963 domain-containing protein [Paenibacillus luteus]|uniref:DUF1963 domain-containing protein n=1 Tax=Paenibacillus luteus TaxID=2545753 RepID=UPI001142AC29|nr:DUF1963 domain-containing protein [Paenibacillus luteus]